MLEELVAQPHCTHVLVKVAIKYIYTISKREMLNNATKRVNWYTYGIPVN